MPRRLYVWLIGSALLCSVCVPSAWSQPAPAELKGVVVSVAGSVKFRNEKTVLWQDLRQGQELSQGDHVRTEADGKVSIKFTNGNIMALKENSAMIIEELHVDPDTGKYDAAFKAIKAKIRAEVNDQTHLNSFEIRTPTAVAGVRGTIFYVNTTETFTQVIVERGRVNLRNEKSNNERDVQAGFTATAIETGDVSEPIAPEPEQLQEFEGFLDPGVPMDNAETQTEETPPTLLEQETLTEEIIDTQSEFLENQQQSLQDRQLAQETTLTDYISNPPPPTGGNLTDPDGDGLLNSVDPDDDNDFLPDLQEVLANTNPLNLDTDNDALTDWEELKLTNSNPLVRDSDGDGIDDGGDTFPTVAATFEPMTPIRNFRYNKLDVIPGLRTEISSMLANSAERQRDYIMDRISDAQMHKVLKDRSGGWARYEEYIFRPTPNEIEMMSLTYRTSVQLSSLSWRIVFNNSLDGLSSQTIKNLPWNSIFSAIPSYGVTAPAHYPTQMNVMIARGANSVEERRTLNAPNFGGTWTQTVTTDMVRTDGGAFANAASTNLIAGNPAAFDYDLGGPLVEFFIYVARDSDGVLSGATFNIASLWQVLGANLGAGFPTISPSDHIEIQTSYGGGPTFIEVVYEPMDRLLWRGDIDWPEQLTW